MTSSAVVRRLTARLSQVRPGQVHAASLLIGLVVLFRLTRLQWFFFDEWAFVRLRLIPGASLAPLMPHVGQLVAMPLIAYRILFDLFQLHTYLPYMAVVLVAHVALAHMLWRVMRRGGVDPWVATALSTVFLCFGAGYEGIVWATQMGLDTALLLGMVQILLVDHDGSPGRRDWLAGLVGLAAVLFLGAGVIMAVIAGAVALVRRGPRAAVMTTLLPVGFYVLWYVLYGHRFPGTPLSGPLDLLRLPDYVWLGLTSTAESVSGLTQAGSVMVVALLAWLVARRRLLGTGGAPAILMAAAAPLAFAIIGIARVSTGLDQAASSRYLYTGAALMIPAAGMALTEISRLSRPALAAVLAAVSLAAVHGSAELLKDARNLADLKQDSKAKILAAAAVSRSGEMVVGTTPDPHAAPQLDYATIALLERLGDLPPIGPVAAPVRLAVAAQLQLALTDSPAIATTDAGAVVHPISALRMAAADGGCLQVDSDGAGLAVDVSLTGPVALALTPATTGTLGVSLADRGDLEHTSPQRGFGVQAGRTAYLDVTVREGEALLSLPRGTNRICGVTAGSAPG